MLLPFIPCSCIVACAFLLEHRGTYLDDPQKVQIGKSSKTERRFCRQNRFADFIVVADCVWLVGIYEAIISRVRCVSKGKSMSLNTDDLKKFEQGVPEKISLSGSFDRNVPRNIRLMTSSTEFFRIDSAEKKLSVCLDWRCTLRKNIIEFMGVVVQATLLISIGYSWFYALLIAGIAGIGGLLYFRFQHQSLAKLNIPCVQVMEMQNGILRLFKNDDLIFMQQDTDFREFDLKDIQCFLCVAATTIYYNHTQWKNDAVWKILYAVRRDSTLECIMFTGDCGTKFYRILAKKCGKKLVTLQHSASFTGGAI